MKRFWKRMVMPLCLACAAVAGACVLQPKIGPLPDGPRLERITASPNYTDGEFRNQQPTEVFTGQAGRFASMLDFLFVPKERLRPERPLPMVKTDLMALAGQGDVAVWLGHSSFFLRLGGKSMLIDPVFGAYAAPFSFMNRAFAGDYPYAPEDMPDIDCLIISHDHWDHLDQATIVAMQDRVKAIVCPLGVGAILEDWGFDPALIHEADWHEDVRLGADLAIHVLPARHFSGRWLTRNKTLWAGFLIETPGGKVFYSGDSGYGPHFAEIGERFGGVDLAIMENGQYDPNWKNIHMMPEEAARGAADLRARALLPAHSGRFSISNHAWDDPYKRLAAASAGKPFRLLRPRIGEVTDFRDPSQGLARWWETEILAARRGRCSLPGRSMLERDQPQGDPMTDKGHDPESRPEELASARQALTKTILRLTANGSPVITAIPALAVSRWEAPTEQTSYMHEPSLCLVAQGAKRVLLGEELYTYDADHYLIASVDLPIVAQVIEASKEKPYLGLMLKLDPRMISQLLVDSNLPMPRTQQTSRGMAVSTITAAMLGAFQRLLDLLDVPEDIPILAPLLQKEIVYRLLVGEQGPRLRQMGSVGSQSHQLSQAIDWLKKNYTRPIRVDDLAAHARMSTSTFHRHFRELTAMSPLQFQKRIRLHEARRMMFSDHLDATSVAFQVGYESSTQFNREYSRLFGAPPLRDIKGLRRQTADKARGSATAEGIRSKEA